MGDRAGGGRGTRRGRRRSRVQRRAEAAVIIAGPFVVGCDGVFFNHARRPRHAASRGVVGSLRAPRGVFPRASPPASFDAVSCAASRPRAAPECFAPLEARPDPSLRSTVGPAGIVANINSSPEVAQLEQRWRAHQLARLEDERVAVEGREASRARRGSVDVDEGGDGGESTFSAPIRAKSGTSEGTTVVTVEPPPRTYARGRGDGGEASGEDGAGPGLPGETRVSEIVAQQLMARSQEGAERERQGREGPTEHHRSTGRYAKYDRYHRRESRSPSSDRSRSGGRSSSRSSGRSSDRRGRRHRSRERRHRSRSRSASCSRSPSLSLSQRAGGRWRERAERRSHSHRSVGEGEGTEWKENRSQDREHLDDRGRAYRDQRDGSRSKRAPTLPQHGPGNQDRHRHPVLGWGAGEQANYGRARVEEGDRERGHGRIGVRDGPLAGRQLLLSGYPPDTTPANVRRLFEKKNIGVQRLQLLWAQRDALGHLPAFVQVYRHEDALVIMELVRRGGVGGNPLSYKGNKLWAAFWSDDRPRHLSHMPMATPNVQDDDILTGAVPGVELGVVGSILSGCGGRGAELVSPKMGTRGAGVPRLPNGPPPRQAFSHAGVFQASGASTNRANPAPEPSSSRDIGAARARITCSEIPDLNPEEAEHFATCSPGTLGEWDGPLKCHVDAKGQMGRLIGPRGSNIQRLRAVCGATFQQDSAAGIMVVTGPDATTVMRGVRLVSANVAKLVRLHAGKRRHAEMQGQPPLPPGPPPEGVVQAPPFLGKEQCRGRMFAGSMGQCSEARMYAGLEEEEEEAEDGEIVELRVTPGADRRGWGLATVPIVKLPAPLATPPPVAVPIPARNSAPASTNTPLQAEPASQGDAKMAAGTAVETVGTVPALEEQVYRGPGQGKGEVALYDEISPIKYDVMDFSDVLPQQAAVTPGLPAEPASGTQAPSIVLGTPDVPPTGSTRASDVQTPETLSDNTLPHSQRRASLPPPYKLAVPIVTGKTTEEGAEGIVLDNINVVKEKVRAKEAEEAATAVAEEENSCADEAAKDLMEADAFTPEALRRERPAGREASHRVCDVEVAVAEAKVAEAILLQDVAEKEAQEALEVAKSNVEGRREMVKSASDVAKGKLSSGDAEAGGVVDDDDNDDDDVPLSIVHTNTVPTATSGAGRGRGRGRGRGLGRGRGRGRGGRGKKKVEEAATVVSPPPNSDLATTANPADSAIIAAAASCKTLAAWEVPAPHPAFCQLKRCIEGRRVTRDHLLGKLMQTGEDATAVLREVEGLFVRFRMRQKGEKKSSYMCASILAAAKIAPTGSSTPQWFIQVSKTSLVEVKYVSNAECEDDEVVQWVKWKHGGDIPAAAASLLSETSHRAGKRGRDASGEGDELVGDGGKMLRS